jgi:hypothetical protein
VTNAGSSAIASRAAPFGGRHQGAWANLRAGCPYAGAMERNVASFLHFFPVRAPEGTTFTGGAFALLPWSAVAFYCLLGTTKKGAPLLAVASEWPLIWLRTAKPLSKFERELLYLRRYSSDRAIATRGNHAWGDVQPGDDPPDATVLTDAGRVGVESTSLTVESRRGVHGLFAQLRRGLQEAEPALFAKLAGHIVYVWFQESEIPGPPVKPHKRSDTPALDALIQELADYEPATEELRHHPGPAPQTMPELPLADTPAGARFYAVPLLGGAPGSMLFTLAGFDIALVYTTLLTAEEAWSEVQRLVDSHDKPGVDLLLVTAGGPDANGNVFPAEEAVANFVVEHPIGLSHSPKHIRRVILHSWGTGRATALYSDIQPIFGPLYQSMTPLHHLFAAQPTGADETDVDASEEDSG